MRITLSHLKPIAAAVAILLLLAVPPMAQTADLDQLYARLADPDNADWQHTQADILREWSKSGSPAMDLLLKRGEAALAAGDYLQAIEHLTALTDQAPDFAEGWNARATAYFYAGYFGPSVADIQRTLALNPHHFGALAGLGMIFEATDRPDQARKAYEASLAIHPHQEGVRQSLDRLEEQDSGAEL